MTTQTMTERREAMLALAESRGWDRANFADAYGPQPMDRTPADMAWEFARRRDFLAVGLTATEIEQAIRDGMARFAAEDEEDSAPFGWTSTELPEAGR